MRKQIRNLEIRLSRYTNNSRHNEEACAQWRARQHFSGDESTEGGVKMDLFRPRNGQLLPTVVGEGEEPMRPYERLRRDRGCPPLTVESHESNATVISTHSNNRAVGGVAADGRRAALDRFRHGCLALGAKAARAGGEAMSVAAAVTSEAAQEAVQSAMAAVGGGRGARGGRSQILTTRTRRKRC